MSAPAHLRTAHPTDFERVAEAIRYLERHRDRQPTLDAVAAAVGLNEFRLHRLFSSWAGTTPKRFLQYLTAEHAKRVLRESRSVLDAAFESGLSSAGRLHDLMVTLEAVSPGEYRRGGAGLTIRWGVHPSPFGDCLVALSGRGLCALEFVDGRRPEEAVAGIAAGRWPEASLAHDPAGTAEIARRIFPAPDRLPGGRFHLLVRGTNFQLRVWRALLSIPPGRVIAYGDLAARLGSPGAARAVGSAVGANPVSFLIPCHRVVRAATGLGEYRWGAERKRALLTWEAARSEAPVAAAG